MPNIRQFLINRRFITGLNRPERGKVRGCGAENLGARFQLRLRKMPEPRLATGAKIQLLEIRSGAARSSELAGSGAGRSKAAPEA